MTNQPQNPNDRNRASVAGSVFVIPSTIRPSSFVIVDVTPRPATAACSPLIAQTCPSSDYLDRARALSPFESPCPKPLRRPTRNLAGLLMPLRRPEPDYRNQSPPEHRRAPQTPPY